MKNGAWWVGSLFLLTLATLITLIVMVLLEGDFRSMMALAAVTYAIAALGFLCVVGWAYAKGQFNDYESIKDGIFELESRQ